MTEFSQVVIRTGEYDTNGYTVIVGDEPYPRILINNDGFAFGDGFSNPLYIAVDGVTQAELEDAISDLIAGAPGGLDTLNELSAALSNDPDFATSMANLVGAEAASRAYVDDVLQSDIEAIELVLNDKADLVGGFVPNSQIPALAISETFPVASQAAMLALTAQRGDVAIRSDVGKTFILSSDNPGTLGAWVEVVAIGAVSSVNGFSGVVVLGRADIGLANVDNTSDVNKPLSTATVTALALKLAAASNLSDLGNAAAARSNLGLGNVNDTSDASKPISTATQSALDNKQPLDTDLTAWAGKTAPSGTAVGTTDAQTLTNKTIVAGSNTITGLSEANFDPAADSLIRNIRIVIDGAGSVLTTGAKQVYVSIPYNCQIVSARILSSLSGSVVLDIWKNTYTNFPPTVADTITAAAKPALSSSQKSENTTLVGWITTINAGDILEVNVDSASSVAKIFLDLKVRLT